MFDIYQSPAALLEWQIEYYTRRLQEARNVKERAFIRRELFNLKRKANA